MKSKKFWENLELFSVVFVGLLAIGVFISYFFGNEYAVIEVVLILIYIELKALNQYVREWMDRK